MKKRLLDLLQKYNGTITEEVIQEALSYDNPKSFFEDLLQHGCISGMVGSLIYYTDTHAFFDKYYDEIEELRTELADQGCDVHIPTHSDLKNFLAWLGFEEKARQLYDELDFER